MEKNGCIDEKEKGNGAKTGDDAKRQKCFKNRIGRPNIYRTGAEKEGKSNHVWDATEKERTTTTKASRQTEGGREKRKEKMANKKQFSPTLLLFFRYSPSFGASALQPTKLEANRKRQ